MLNRSSQILTLLMLRNRAGTLFSHLPHDLIRHVISECGQNNLTFNKALHHVAFGELEKVQAMLSDASDKKNKTKLKELLLSAGHVVTPAGLTVKYTTLLECAVGSGDPEMIEMIKSYFPKFGNGIGIKEMEKQLERYRKAIIELPNQQPEDLTWLFDIIKRSSAKDVAAELARSDQYDPSYQSPLRMALNRFRKEKLDPKKRIITTPRMHCNYKNLLHAYDMLYLNVEELKEWDPDPIRNRWNYDKCNLVACQIIGFIQLVELPARERYLFARDQISDEAMGKKITVERKINYKHDSKSFFSFDVSFMMTHSGFGFDFFSSVYGCRGVSWNVACGCKPYKTCVQKKSLDLQNLLPQLPQTENNFARHCSK